MERLRQMPQVMDEDLARPRRHPIHVVDFFGAHFDYFGSRSVTRHYDVRDLTCDRFAFLKSRDGRVTA